MKPKHDPSTPAKGKPLIASVPWDQRTWVALLILLVVTAALYWPVLQCDYIDFDDYQYAAQNEVVKAGLTWQGIAWAFITPVANNWHPLTMISLMLDCDLWGAGPWGHHFANLVLHVLNTGLVFLFLRQLTGAYWRSLFVAAWFGWHPLHVESVAWIAERKDVLSTFFWLLALWCYGLYAQTAGSDPRKSRRWYALSLVLTALGLMSKAMLVTMPCVLLLLDFWPLNRWQPERIKALAMEKLPFFIMVTASSIVTYIVQQNTGAVMTITDYPIAGRISNALISYCRYLFKTFWPTNLAIYYPHPGEWPVQYGLAALLAICTVTGFAIWMARKGFAYWVTGWFWFLGTLVPVLGLVQVGTQAMADRYMYFPSIGVFIIISWGIHQLLETRRLPKGIYIASGITMAVLCLGKTEHELGNWKNTETIFAHAVAVTKTNCVAEEFLGKAYLQDGKSAAAVPLLTEAIRIDPKSSLAHMWLGVAYLQLTQLDTAEQRLHEAINLNPSNADAHFDLGMTYLKLNAADPAIAEFQETLRLKPNDPSTLKILAGVNALKSNQDAFKGSLDLNNQAWDLATNPDPAKRDGAKAVTLAESACEQTQYRLPILVGTLAAAYAEAGRFDEAVAMARKACDLATQTGETNLVSRNQELMKLYQTHQAYHGQ